VLGRIHYVATDLRCADGALQVSDKLTSQSNKFNLTPPLIRIGFNADAVGFLQFLEYSIDILFIVDIMINFRTGYFDADLDIQVMNPRKAAMNYLRGWFLLDLVSSIPFDLVQSMMDSGEGSDLGSVSTAKLLKTGRFVKIFRLLRITKLIR